MSRLLASLAALLVTMAPIGAVAQQSPPPPPKPPVQPVQPPLPPPPPLRFDRSQQFLRTEAEIFRQNLTRQAQAQPSLTRQARADRTRVALADRIAPLVDAGSCGEAERLARQERDSLMARRVRELCVPTSVN